jgi:hypothetical protein
VPAALTQVRRAGQRPHQRLPLPARAVVAELSSSPQPHIAGLRKERNFGGGGERGRVVGVLVAAGAATDVKDKVRIAAFDSSEARAPRAPTADRRPRGRSAAAEGEGAGGLHEHAREAEGCRAARRNQPGAATAAACAAGNAAAAAAARRRGEPSRRVRVCACGDQKLERFRWAHPRKLALTPDECVLALAL